ncbi:MAG TPA: PilZ domain-containing protein [Caulobacteraceae bacterium]
MGTPASDSKAGSEARGAPRRRTLLGATIVHGEDLLTLACTVRDWSDTGVKIELPPMTVLPDRFWLLDHRTAVAYEAKLLWRRENRAGLELIGHSALDAASDPRLRILRRIWVEKAPR